MKTRYMQQAKDSAMDRLDNDIKYILDQIVSSVVDNIHNSIPLKRASNYKDPEEILDDLLLGLEGNVRIGVDFYHSDLAAVVEECVRVGALSAADTVCDLMGLQEDEFLNELSKLDGTESDDFMILASSVHPDDDEKGKILSIYRDSRNL